MNKIHISNATIPKIHTRFRNIPQWKDTFDKINYHEYDIYGSFTANGVLNWTIPANTSIQPKQLMMINQRYIPATTNTIVVSGGFIEGTNMIHNGFGIYFDDNNYILCHSNATVGKLLVVINGVLVFYSGNNTVLGSMKIIYDRSTNIIRYYRYQSGWNLLVTTTQVMPNVDAKLFVGTIKSNGSNTSNLIRSLSQVYFTPFDYSDEIPTFNNGNRYEFMSKYIIKVNFIYGYLYNHFAVKDSRNIVNPTSNYIIPESTTYSTLSSYIQTTSEEITSGNVTRWLKLNRYYPDNHPRYEAGDTYPAVELFNFNGEPNGQRSSSGPFALLGERWMVWTNTNYASDPTNRGNYINIRRNTGLFTIANTFKRYGYGLRLFRLATTEEQALIDGTILYNDYRGNNNILYNATKIGTQIWLCNNLIESKYGDGTPIPEVTDDTEWRNLTTGARCSYNNDESNAFIIE